jgi:hypothetical protein
MSTVTLNKTQNSELWIPCGKCHGKTCHRVVVSVDFEGKFLTNYQENYQVVQCQGCRTFSFRKAFVSEIKEANSEDLYPSRVAGRHELSQVYLLPPEVARIYKETHSALCDKQPVLAGIGIRALIETVCKEKVAQGGNLEKKIDSLVATGVLTKDGAEILHSLRVLGNVAAHEVQPHSEETLGIAMDVVEHLLQGVYVLPKVAKKLPK